MKRREVSDPGQSRPADTADVAARREIMWRREQCLRIRDEAIEGIATEVPGTRYHDLWMVTIWELKRLAESDDPDPVEAAAILRKRRAYRPWLERSRAFVEAGNERTRRGRGEGP